MKRTIKKVLFKIQGTQIAHLLIPLLWAPVHAFIYNRIFNKSYSGARSDSPFKFYEPTVETEAFVQEIKTYLDASNLLVKVKGQMISSVGLRTYVKDIFPELPINLRAAAYKVELNDLDLRAQVAMYFGFMPRLHDINLLYNIPIEGSSEEGSKLWHRDAGDCDLKNMKVFMPITDISSENGPFFFLENKKYAAHHNVLSRDQNSDDPWVAERVSNHAVLSLEGKVHSTLGARGGQRLLIDTVNTYHKGGFCASKERLMLQAGYHGDGYNAVMPMAFTEEIAFLQKDNFNLNEKEINRESAARDYYCKQPRLTLFFKKLVWKLGNVFVCR